MIFHESADGVRIRCRCAGPCTRTIGYLALAVAILSAAPAAALSERSTDRPQVALVLAGGGALGFAHVGAIEVIEEIGIPVDIVVGTSMGAIVGGLYASGYGPAEMSGIVERIDWSELMLDSTPRAYLSLREKSARMRYLARLDFQRGHGLLLSPGLVSGDDILRSLDYLLGTYGEDADFDELPRRFRAIAADIETGEEVVLGSGSLPAALRASMSVPGVFSPVSLDGRLLVDGGIVSNLPVDVARDLGADIVIAVDLERRRLPAVELRTPAGVLLQAVDILVDATKARQYALADIIISPDLGDHRSTSFAAWESLIRRGKEGANLQREHLAALLDELPAAHQRPPAEPPVSDIDRAIPAGLDRRASTTGAGDTSADGGVRIGFSYESHFGPIDEEQFSVTVGLSAYDRSGPGSRLALESRLARSQHVALRAYQPLTGRWYSDVSLSYDRMLRTLHETGDPSEQYESHIGAIDTSVGWMPWRTTALALGYRLAYIDSGPRYSGVQIEPFRGVASGLRAELSHDTLDRFPFPNRGAKAGIEFSVFDGMLGSEIAYQRLSSSFRGYLPLADRHVLASHLRLDTSLDTFPPIWDSAWIGGREDFPGYDRFALRRRNLATAGAGYRYRLPFRAAALRDRIYLTVRAAAGAVSDDPASAIVDRLLGRGGSGTADISAVWGTGIGTGARTPLGAIQTEIGVRDGPGAHLSFSIGNHF